MPGFQDPAFSTAVTALGAKLAKADGRADTGEYAAFAEVFPTAPTPGLAAGCAPALRPAGAVRPPSGLESYTPTPWPAAIDGCPNCWKQVLDGLFHIAESDGVVTGSELDYLERVSTLFGLSPLTFRRLKATHLGLAADDPYAVLRHRAGRVR